MFMDKMFIEIDTKNHDSADDLFNDRCFIHEKIQDDKFATSKRRN